MNSTALFDAEDALKDLITGCDSASGWSISVGFPGTVKPKHIWIAEQIDDDDQVFGVSDLTAKDETFSLRVNIYCLAKVKDYVTPRDRCRPIIDDIATALIADFTLGGVVELAQITRIDRDGATPDEGREAFFSLLVTCRSWLT